jgi:hypothetical protein
MQSQSQRKRVMRMSERMNYLILVLALVGATSAAAPGPRGEDDPRMQRRVPELRLKELPLPNAIDLLREMSGQNFFVDWPSLEAAQVTRKTTITSDVPSGRFIESLRAIVAGAGKDLDFRVRNTVVFISTKQKLEHPAPVARLPRGDDPAANAKASLALDHKLPEVDFHGVSFVESLNYLQDETKLQFVVDWDRLAKAGIKKDTPVTLRLRNVPAGDVVEYVIRSLAGAAPVQFALRDGTVAISTVDTFDEDRMTRTFDVSDLLPDVAREATADKLLRRVKEAMAPVLNDDHRPTSALLKGDHLFVTQTPENIRAVAFVLGDLREERYVRRR